jgi:MFS family permease
MLFAACFCSGFGVMVLDISIAAIFGVVIPSRMRARVAGAFQAMNYGTRPAGALLGGILGTELGLRPALWIAVTGGVLGSLLLFPSPLPRFRMPDEDQPRLPGEDQPQPPDEPHPCLPDEPLPPHSPSRAKARAPVRGLKRKGARHERLTDEGAGQGSRARGCE